MAESIWTVKAESVRIPLVYIDAQGDTRTFWVDVKKRLNVGEKRNLVTAGWKGVRHDNDATGEIRVDWSGQSFARALAYLTDWSLTDNALKKLPLTREGVETLDEEVFDIIDAAIVAHVAAMDEEKKLRTGSVAP